MDFNKREKSFHAQQVSTFAWKNCTRPRIQPQDDVRVLVCFAQALAFFILTLLVIRIYVFYHEKPGNDYPDLHLGCFGWPAVYIYTYTYKQLLWCNLLKFSISRKKTEILRNMRIIYEKKKELQA